MATARAMAWILVGAACLAMADHAAAQEPNPPAPAPEAPATQSPMGAQTGAQTSSPNGAPVRITLQDALDRARKYSVTYQAAVTTAGIARQDRTQARNALLPSVIYNNSVIYTQGVGTTNAAANGGVPVVFIANNAVHEYLSQADVHESIDAAGFANFRKMAAAAAVAKAQAEVASRGLGVTVVQAYFSVGAAQQKLETARRNSEEGDRFLKITQELEKGGEVAHADVVKAELQSRDRQRQLLEAQLALLNARLNLSILIFPDFNDNFEVADDLHAVAPLTTREEFQQRAARDNPDLRAALAAVQQSNHDVFGARAGYLPTLVLDYFYGIDAARFAKNTVVDGHRFSNLGSSIVGTLNIPVWNWGTTQSKVKQAELRRNQAKRELSMAQRRLLAEIRSIYAEAETSLTELEGLHRSAELAEESLQLVTLRYRKGEATVLEVVDAQTTFATASSAYQDGAVRYRSALANLQTLTGVLTTP